MEHDLIQLFDVESSTFTYFLVDRATREAMAIDSVDRQVERDLALIKRLDLKLRYALETHAHADHITGAARLVAATGALAAAPSGCGIVARERAAATTATCCSSASRNSCGPCIRLDIRRAA